MNLYHYTCDHGAEGIERDGQIVPNKHTGVAWFTDLPTPDVAKLGLTSHMLKCDRTAHRFRVTKLFGIYAFAEVWRGDEMLPGDPFHWWVAFTPVPAVRDEVRA